MKTNTAKNLNRISWIYLLYLILLPWTATAADTEKQEAEQWFYSDAEQQALEVNEGELVFISPPQQAILHSQNRISITEHSLTNGWLALTQCYYHLDPVPETVIRYQYKDMKNLRVIKFVNIADVRTNSQSIELEDIRDNASLCIRADVLLLETTASGYQIRNGPYHRKFLDGYYPFHVSLLIEYPSELIQLDEISPDAQPGFEIRKEKNSLEIISWFEGQLIIDVKFRNR